MRKQIILACTETGDRNYSTTKNKKNTPERLEVKKYSPLFLIWGKKGLKNA